MDVDVEVRAVLPFPREVVAAYAGDPSNAPDWYANIDSVRWQPPPPVTVGSRMDFEARFLGRRLAYTYEVVELVPGERLDESRRAGRGATRRLPCARRGKIRLPCRTPGMRSGNLDGV